MAYTGSPSQSVFEPVAFAHLPEWFVSPFAERYCVFLAPGLDRVKPQRFGSMWRLTDCPQLTGMTSPPGLRPREPRRALEHKSGQLLGFW